MTLPVTESLHPDARGLDALAPEAVLARLLAGQQAALAGLAPALPEIARGARLMAEAILGGKRLIYGGAGSSALMAMADALEIPGTYGIAPERITILMAGGVPCGSEMPGDTEDDAGLASTDAGAIGMGDAAVIVTASGATPYALVLAGAARERGARVIAVANNPGAPIFAGADAAICLPTPPEIIGGSTRMGAGTAQKAALNMMSTLMAIHLGAVHDGMMVGLVADNAKLRRRAARNVASIAGVTEDAAQAALDRTGGAVRLAVLCALGASPAEAGRLLDKNSGRLRDALKFFGPPG